MLMLRLLSEGGEGPNTALVWMLYAGMAFLFLMIIIGWWSSSRNQSQSETPFEKEEGRLKGDRKK